jgi:hypothetical protein
MALPLQGLDRDVAVLRVEHAVDTTARLGLAVKL